MFVSVFDSEIQWTLLRLFKSHFDQSQQDFGPVAGGEGCLSLPTQVRVRVRKRGGWSCSSANASREGNRCWSLRGSGTITAAVLLESGESALLIFLPDEPLCIRWRGGGWQDVIWIRRLCVKVRLTPAPLLYRGAYAEGGNRCWCLCLHAL